MAFGMGILGLMLLRALIRWRSTPLAPLPGQTPLAESAARWGHAAMYAMVILMAISGMTMTIVARLNDIVFARNGDPLPPTLEIYPSRMIHGWLAILFALLIAGHIAMALYHRFGKGEPVFRRIWFGRRQAATRP
jgi:cytochrome b561